MITAKISDQISDAVYKIRHQCQQLIMILKFLHKNISRLNYGPLIKNSTFLFSKDDGNKNGFDKFKRKTSPQTHKPQQPNKSPEKQLPNQKNQQDQSHGFGHFKRNAKKQSTPQPSQDANVNKSKKNQINSETNTNTNKMNLQQDKVNKPTEKENQNNSASEESTKGFRKFKRKAGISNQTNQANQIKKQNHVQSPKINIQKPVQQPSHQQQAKSSHQKLNQQQKGFGNFQGRRKKVDISPKNTQTKQVNQDNQKISKEPPNDNQKKEQVPEQKKARQANSGFSKFKLRQNKPEKKQKKQENKQQTPSNPDNLQQEGKEAEATSHMKPKDYKSLQQLQKQEAEANLKEKEDFFKKKVKYYKKRRAEKLQPTYLSSLLEMKKKLEKEFQQRTGIDINAYQEPPQWVKSNPMLMIIFGKWKSILFAFLLYLILTNYSEHAQQITSEQFIHYIDSGQAQIVTFKQNQHDIEMETGKKHDSDILVRLKTGELYMTESNKDFENLVLKKVNILNSINPTNQILILHSHKQNFNIITNIRFILSMTLIYLFFSSLFGATSRMGKGGAGKTNLFQESQSKRFQQKVNVKFNDVVGMQKSKQEIVEFIDFLVNPDKYHRLGAKIPRGALLTGPPGTGKTMIAKACAGESNVPFFTISGSEFIEMYVGVGAQRVRDLFKQAKEAAPSIIFIDEIDAVGKKRSSGMNGGNDERDNTLNQLLVQMDGFQSNSNVIVFAATNQKDVLDPALTRPGRFDRLIEVDLPDIEGRKQIFMVHLKPIVIDEKSTIQDYARRMATLTPGFSGADIKNLCNEAAIMAARNGNKFVTVHDFELATQRVIAGVEKKSHLITEQTRRIVAYHECGHGVASWFLQGANPLLKITIIPRSKGSLGFAQYLPHETQISNKKQLEDQICVILAGRVAEEVFFKKISTGAYDDLQKAYKIAKMIVTQYGMDQRLGWLTYEQTQYAKYYSRKTQEIIDQQIMKIIKDCTVRTRALIQTKRELIDKLAHKLLEVETIDLTTISEILGERPFKPNKQYEQYLNQRKKMVEEVDKNKNNPDGNSGESGQKQDPIAAMTDKWREIKKQDYLL